MSDLCDVTKDLKQTALIDDLQLEELDPFNHLENEIYICLQPKAGDVMQCGLYCAIQDFEHQSLDESVEKDKEEIYAARMSVVQKIGCLSDVLDAARFL